MLCHLKITPKILFDLNFCSVPNIRPLHIEKPCYFYEWFMFTVNSKIWGDPNFELFWRSSHATQGTCMKRMCPENNISKYLHEGLLKPEGSKVSEFCLSSSQLDKARKRETHRREKGTIVCDWKKPKSLPKQSATNWEHF